MNVSRLMIVNICFLFACTSIQKKDVSFAELEAELPAGVERSNFEAVGSEYMITTQGEGATGAALKMLETGGNLIDAAVASSFAISVERPQSTGIGGGGFMLLHLAEEDKTYAFDFREIAPLSATKDMFLDEDGEVLSRASVDGPLASGVPGLVAGLVAIHERFGSLPLNKVIEPSIELAEKGFPVYPELAQAIERRSKVLLKSPAAKAIFFDGEGLPLKEGAHLVQKDLANTLKSIAADGTESFYKGWIAKAIAKSQKESGGLITLEDLKSYEMKERLPVRVGFRDYEVVSMPPPSSGGAHVLQILNILENIDLTTDKTYSPRNIHYTASAMQMAFADRATYLGDADFVPVPVFGLINKGYAQELFESITENKARPQSAVEAGPAWNWDPNREPEHTIHFTMMDAAGNTIASTQTINGTFGSGIVVEGTGIVLNNEMDDFSAKPGATNIFGAVGSEMNAVEPGKRPLSSMSPTIVMQGGTPLMALGSPAGTRIITCVAQTMLNYLTYEKPLYDSVASMRYHHQWQPDEIRVDQPGFPPGLTRALKRKGYKVNTSNLGCRVNAIAREDDQLRGVSDPRGEGLARGR